MDATSRGKSNILCKTFLWFSSEALWTKADNCEAAGMHTSFASASPAALATNQHLFSTLNRGSKDQRSSSLSHSFNTVVALAYTFPAQMKGIIILCDIHCTALGLQLLAL